MADPELTQKRLRELLYYEPNTGVWTWLVRKAQRVKAGDRAGCFDPSDGYWRITIDGRSYGAHRLAFLYVTGVWPIKDVDHVNLNKTANQWVNLRQATTSQNQANTAPNNRNKSGFKGVFFNSECRVWRAQITVEQKNIYLGAFATKELAAAAYAKAAGEYFQEFART